MAKRKKNPIKRLFGGIYRIVDKIIITPISTVVYKISEKLGKESKLEKLLNRPYMLVYLSLIFAILLFVFVDSDATNYRNTEVDIIPNQKINVKYNSSAYVIEDLPETVDITLIGKKGQIYLAKRLGDNEVLLDLSDYEASDTPVKVKLTYNKTINSLDYKLDPSYVTVTIRKKVSAIRSVTYDLLNQDKLDSKLSVKKVELSKSEVVVKGAQDTLDKIATVKALINLDNSEFTQAGSYDVDNVSLVAYDISGSIVKNVEIVSTNITAKVELNSYSKKVPVNVLTTGELISGKAISSIKINDTDISNYNITIYGDESVINTIEYLPVEVEVTNLNSNKVFNVNLTQPTGIRDLSIKTIKITITLGDEITKEIENVMIEKTNLDPAYKAAAIGENSTKTTVVVKGTKEVLNAIDESKIKAIVDLSGYKEGDHEVTITVIGDDVKATYTPKTTKIKIRISKK